MNKDVFTRLQQVKSYAGELREHEKADTLWMIDLVQKMDEENSVFLRNLKAKDKTIAKLEKIVARLSGNQKIPPCPCLNPDDHAGWCPRRERD